jgi:ankyrin repeat protein
LTAQNNQGRNALLAALREHHEEVGIQLITAGVPVNVQDTASFTPLYAAAQDGRITVVNFLIAAGAEVDTICRDGMTALNWTSSLGHMRVIDALLTAGANPNIASKDGWTPLMKAVNVVNKALIQKLFAAPADINAVNNEGHNILDIARIKGNNEIIDIVEKKFAADERARYAPIREGSQRAVKTIKTISFKNRNTPLGS